jgi:hypothetical protein
LWQTLQQTWLYSYLACRRMVFATFYSKVFLLDTGDKRQNGWDTSRLLGTWLTQDSWEWDFPLTFSPLELARRRTAFLTAPEAAFVASPFPRELDQQSHHYLLRPATAMASSVSKKFLPPNAFIKRETQYEPLTSGENDIESESGSDTLLLLLKRGFNSVSFFPWLVIIANLVIFVFSGSALFHTYKRGEKIHINENLKTLSLYCGCPCNHVVRKQAIYKVLSSPPHRHRNPPHNSHEPSTIRRWRLHNLPRPPKSRSRCRLVTPKPRAYLVSLSLGHWKENSVPLPIPATSLFCSRSIPKTWVYA